jgi:hypothetical protein
MFFVDDLMSWVDLGFAGLTRWLLTPRNVFNLVSSLT